MPGVRKPARKTKDFWRGPTNGGYEDEYPAYSGARFPLSKVPRTDSVRSRAYSVSRNQQQKQSPDSGPWGVMKKISNAVGLTDEKQWDASELAKVARKKRLRGKGG